MGLYERRICPHVTELALRGGWAHKLRRQLLAPVGGRVLEIGFGTGLNLQHYTDAVTELAILDPGEGMHRLARERIAASPLAIEAHRLGAESLPFPDARFDAVVCTFTLCTVADPSAVARELHRVLVPSGSLHLVEHVGSSNPRLRRWQDRLNPVQKLVACGCNLNREVEPHLEAAGFASLALERLSEPRMPPLLRELVRGTAYKGAA